MTNEIWLLITYGLSIAALIIAMIAMHIAHKNDVKLLKGINADLMNRYMSRDFQDYAHGRRVLIPEKREDVILAEKALNMDDRTKDEAEGLPVN